MSSLLYSTAAGALGGLFLDVFVDDNPDKVFTLAGTISAIALHSFSYYFGLGTTIGGLAAGGVMLLDDRPARIRTCSKSTLALLSGMALGRVIEESYRVLRTAF